jgi:tetratricopeptide (TPR) repeat protein
MSQADPHWESVEEAAELISDGEHASAISMLHEILTREPDNEYAYYYLGCAHYELEEYDRALKGYVKALELAPTYIGAMLHAGHTLRMLGRYAEAMRMGQQILLRSPSDPDALFLIGSAAFARGDDAKAKDFLVRYLGTSPEIEVATEVNGMLQLIEARNPTERLE